MAHEHHNYEISWIVSRPSGLRRDSTGEEVLNLEHLDVAITRIDECTNNDEKANGGRDEASQARMPACHIPNPSTRMYFGRSRSH